MKQHELNIVRIKAVIRRLGPLADQVVFVGGAITGFFISDPAAAEVRPTKDVDMITDVDSRSAYDAQEKTLRDLGIINNMDAAICSFRFEDNDLGEVLVDFMPTGEQVLGFRNKWYKLGFQNALRIDLGDDVFARIIGAPHFLATKLEAFADRGNYDYYGSSDMSDIVQLIDGRPELLNEIRAADSVLKDFLKESFEKLLTDMRFEESIEGHLRRDPTSRDRAESVIERIKECVNLD